MSTLSKIINRWGFIKGIKIYYEINQDKTSVWHLNELKHPVHLRLGTSDHMIFKQIFGMGEYDLEIPFKPATIIDAGANIGLFAIVMANRFPAANIISIEPDPGNYDQLMLNTNPYSGVTAVKAGIWDKSVYLKIVDEGYSEWGLQVKEMDHDGPGHVKAITIPEIMKTHGFESLDIVKIDIEGAEEALFRSNYEAWLPKTKMLIVELHERNWPGVSKNFRRAIAKYSYTGKRHGEYEVFIKN